MCLYEQKDQQRIQTANTLFNYVIGSIKPEEITLDYYKTRDLMIKLLVLQMEVPNWIRTEIENLSDEKIMNCVASTRDICYKQLNLVYEIIKIMPTELAELVSERLQAYNEYRLHYTAVE